VLYFSRFKVFSILLVFIFGIYFFIPNILPISNNILFSNKKVNLGLDLQGGSYLLLEIDSKPLIEQKLQSKSLELRRELREKNLIYTNFRSEKDSLLFNFKLDQRNTLEQFLNDKVINPIISSTGREFSAIYQSDIVTITFTVDLLNLIKKNALEQSIEIVRNRIDELGTKEPNIITRGLDRILVELPGLKDPGEIKKLLGKTAQLNFRFLSNSNIDSSLGVDILNSPKKDRYSIQC